MSRPLSAIIGFLVATEIGVLSAKRRGRDLKWILLIVQSLIICTLALSALRRGPWFDLKVVIAFAVCLGLQNGVVNTIDGVAVHPSYMSGTATRLLRSWPAAESHGTPSQNVARFPASIISGGALAGFVVGALCAVAARASVGTYAPVLLCLPLLAAATASSRRWQVNRNPKHS